MNKRGTAFVSALLVVLALALTTSIAFAGLELVETSTKSKGATTITWDSSFADFDYTLGSTITMIVTWSVDSGAANYDDFALKVNKKGKGGFTPRGKDPARGEMLSVMGNSGNSVTVEFSFTDLHLDRKRNLELGNAHFKLYLWIDVDGDGIPETRAGYGVNVHVEDPQ